MAPLKYKPIGHEFKAEDVEYFNEAVDEYHVNSGDRTPFWKLNPDKQRQLIQIAMNKCFIAKMDKRNSQNEG